MARQRPRYRGGHACRRAETVRRRSHRLHRNRLRHPRRVSRRGGLRRHQGRNPRYAKGVGRDLGPRNITVNVVQPGIMPTDMASEAAANLPDAVMDLHAIRRIATVEEVAASVCFLAGPDAGYITGTVLEVSGGYQI